MEKTNDHRNFNDGNQLSNKENYGNKDMSNRQREKRNDPSTVRTNDKARTDEDRLHTDIKTANLSSITNHPTQVRDYSVIKSKDEDTEQLQITRSNVTHIKEGSEKQNHADEGHKLNDIEEKNEARSNLINNYSYQSNSLVNLWQNYVAASANICAEFVKAWTNTIKR